MELPDFTVGELLIDLRNDATVATDA